jgi:hypothetical protein
MKLKNLTLKSDMVQLQVGEGRSFSGYATVFGNKNSYGFSIEKGAYDEILLGARPKMFFNHESSTVPIGIWKQLNTDDHGLFVVGELTEGIPLADEILAAIRHGSVDGMSVCIGFEDTVEYREQKIVSKVLSLPEISVVTYPSDDQARIKQVLSEELEERIGSLSSESEFEDFLRDACGLSRARAKQFVSCFKAFERGQREADCADDKAKELLRFAKHLEQKSIIF